LKSYKFPLDNTIKVIKGFQFIRSFMSLGFEVHIGLENNTSNEEKVFLGTLENWNKSILEAMILKASELPADNGVCSIELAKYDNIFRLPTLLLLYRRLRFNRGLLRIYKRDFGCRAYDEIKGVSIINVLKNSYGSIVFYRKRNDYYIIFDSIFSTFQTKLLSRIRGIKYSANTAILDYGEFTSILSPQGVIDIPFNIRGFESLGCDVAEGVIYLFKRDDERVFSLDKIGVLEPVMMCRRPLSFLTRSGRVAVVCPETGENIGVELEGEVIQILRRFGRKKRYFILLPYVLWIDDAGVNVGFLDGLGYNVDYKVFLSVVDDGASMNIKCYGKRIPDEIVYENLRLLLNDVDVTEVSILKVHEDFGFLIGSNLLKNVIRVRIRTCMPLDREEVKLCGDKGCSEPILLSRCGDCCYIAYFDYLGDYIIIGDSKIKIKTTNIIDINIDIIFKRIKPISHKYLMYEGLVKASQGCSIYNIDAVSPSCNLYTIRSGEFRLYCRLTLDKPPGFLLVKCNGLDFPILIPLHRLQASKGKLGVINNVNFIPSKSFDMLEIQSEGLAVVEVEGLSEVFEGHLIIRLPYGNSNVVVVDKYGFRVLSYLSPSPPFITIELEGGNVIRLTCNEVCNIICGSNIFKCTSCSLPLESILSKYCKVIVFSLRGYKEYDTKRIFELIVRKAIEKALTFANLFKLV
jgi:hypothetical protein